MATGQPSNPFEELRKARSANLIPGSSGGGPVGRMPGPNMTGYTSATPSYGVGGPATGAKKSQEERELETARANAARRILSDPNARANNPDFLIAELEKIASGGQKKSGGGFLGELGKAALGGLGGLGYVLGRPVALVTSGAKELADVVTEGDASFSDFWKQLKSAQTTPSKYISKSGNKRLDQIIGFAADVAGDPLTYTTFGASQYASRSGRIALAAKAAEADMIARAPSLAPKVADGSIARLGEWALDDFEREVLGVPKGLSWTFGGGKIGKEGTLLSELSGKAAETVGKPLAHARAAIGDIEMLGGIQKVISPKSVKTAGLVRYGRGANMVGESLDDIVRKLGGSSAAMRGKSLGNTWLRRIAEDREQTLKDVVAYEKASGLKLIDVVEEARPAVDSAEQAIADRFKQFLGRARDEANKVMSEFSSRRGVSVYDIGHRENYVPHVITNDAKEWIKSTGFDRSPWRNQVSDMLDIDMQEFISGPGTMRARKLSQGQEFLGKKLNTDIGDGAARMAEINDISQDVLGFKWFEDDAATYMNSYLNSLAAQVKRVGFADRMYDYGNRAVRAIDYELIPDKDVIRELRTSKSILDKAKNALGTEARKVGNTIESVGRRSRGVAEKVVRTNAGDPLLSDIELLKINKSVQEARKAYDAAATTASQRGTAIKEAFDTMSAPHRAKLEALEKAISENNQAEIAAIIDLEDLHVKTFPNAKRRPTSAKDLADQIVAKTQSRTGQRLQALQTRKDRLLRSVSPRGKAGRAVVQAEAQATATRAELDAIDREIQDLTPAVERATEDFPDGVIYIRKDSVDPTTGAVAEGGVDVYSTPPVGADPNDFVVAYAPQAYEPGLSGRIIKPWENGEDYMDFVDGIGTGVGSAINKLGDRQTAEAFDQMWNDVLRGGVNAIDPSFAAAEPELANILARAEKMGSRDFSNMSPSEFSNMFDNDMETIATLLDGWMNRTASLDPSFPNDVFEDGVNMLRYAIGDMGNPAQGFSDIIGVDIGDMPVFGDRGGLIMNSGHLERTLELLPPDSTVYQMVQRAGASGQPVEDITSALMGAQERRGIAESLGATTEAELQAAQQAVAEKQAQATAAGRAQGGIKSAQQKLETKVTGLSSEAERAAAESAAATKAVPKVRNNIKKIENDMKSAMKADPVFKVRDDANKTLTSAVAQFDTATALRGERQVWEQTYGEAYRNEIDVFNQVLADRPPSGAAAEIQFEWNRRMNETIKALESAPLEPAQRDALNRALQQQYGLESQLAVLEGQRKINADALEKALAGRDGNATLVPMILDGWEAIESMGIQMPSEVREMLFSRVRELSNPTEWEKYIRSYRAYNNFFKITAMLSPGFLVRNSYTAAFNNFVAGVGLGDQLKGLRFASKVYRQGLDAALNDVPQAERALFEKAYQAVVATGAGQTADVIVQPVAGGFTEKLLNNKVVKAWAKANEATEISARMGLALNSLRKDLSFDDVVNQIKRYHFDYTDLSSLDQVARNLIPFWIFASRNIPLQFVNSVARPSMYRAYESAQRNFPPDKDLVLPQWLAQRQPLGANALLPFLPKGAVINPDLPQVDMAEQLSMFTDPARLLSQASPLIKLPVEMLGGRQLYQDIPFKDAKSDIRGPLDWPAFLAGLFTGSSGRRPDGSAYTTSRVAYAIPNLLPTLATLQRLLPKYGGKEAYVDRASSSRLGFFGLPYRQVPQQDQFNELTRRQFAISDYLSELTRRGLLTPKTQK